MSGTKSFGESFRVTRQMELYTAGSQSSPTAIPVSPEEIQEKARSILSPEAYDWVAGAAGREETVRNNREAFERWQIVPRMMRDISNRQFNTTILGQSFRYPVFLAPIGVQGLMNPGGEAAVGRAAAALGVPLVLSTVASKSMEEVASGMGDSPRWFQLYWPNHEELAISMISRAKKAGYTAIVVTLDTPTLGWRERNLTLGYLPFLAAQGLANYMTDPVFARLCACDPFANPSVTAQTYLKVFSDLKRTWKDLAWFRKHTDLPILVKGVQHPEDARSAIDAGVDGIIVSNHGGRQVDGSVGTLTMLPDILVAVDGRVPVMVDSGIRRGCDVIKALALGAKAVLVGRPYVFALAINGETGVRDFLSNFLADMDLSLALTGCSKLADLHPGLLRPAP